MEAETKNPLIKFWQRSWWTKLITIVVGFFVFLIIISLSSPQGQKNFKEERDVGKTAGLRIQTSPESSPTFSPMPTPLSSEPSPTRKVVMGSTPKGIEFYKKVESLIKQGKVNGELCTEFESDPIVDVNPESPAVQLSLMYPSISGSVKSSDKILILNDFKVIKALAEQDKSMVLPEYGTLRLFVLTFHDNSCIAKGELQQLMIDNAPEWVDWKQ